MKALAHVLALTLALAPSFARAWVDLTAIVGALTTVSLSLRPPIAVGDSSPIASKVVVGRSAISYVDVVAFEASIGDSILKLGPRSIVPSVSCSTVPGSKSKQLVLHLDSEIVDEVSTYVEDFISIIAIFRFRGFWPSLLTLHVWISKFWEPIISDSAQIYLVAKRFF